MYVSAAILGGNNLIIIGGSVAAGVVVVAAILVGLCYRRRTQLSDRDADTTRGVNTVPVAMLYGPPAAKRPSVQDYGQFDGQEASESTVDSSYAYEEESRY